MNIITLGNSLYNSEDPERLLIECIDNLIDGKDNTPLTEAVGTHPLFNEYLSLMESVESLNKIEKDITDAKDIEDLDKKGNIIVRISKSLKKAVNWWYKVDPDKKCKTLHTILKLLLKAIKIILIIKIGKGIATKELAARLPIGYEGNKKVLEMLFSRKAIASSIISTLYIQLCNGIKKISNNVEYSVNKTDIDKAIQEYDNTIDELNKQIASVGDPQIKMSLEKCKNNAESALYELIRIKEDHIKKERKKNNKRKD